MKKIFLVFIGIIFLTNIIIAEGEFNTLETKHNVIVKFIEKNSIDKSLEYDTKVAFHNSGLSKSGTPELNLIIVYFKDANIFIYHGKENNLYSKEALKLIFNKLETKSINEESLKTIADELDKLIEKMDIKNEEDGEKDGFFKKIGGFFERIFGREIEDEEIQIFKMKGDKKFRILSEEKCKNGVKKRKEKLGVPDKLCYWKEMTKIYNETCENLEEKEIEEIFKMKKEYEEEYNKDWPSLNIDKDFCVPVVYDCEKWKKMKGSLSEVHGRVNLKNPEKTIEINPYLNFSRKEIVFLILHEGLHSIQSTSSTFLLNWKYLNQPEARSFMNEKKNLENNIKSIVESWVEKEKKIIKDIKLKAREGSIEEYKKAIEESNKKLDEIEPLIREVKNFLNQIDRMTYSNPLIDYNDYISKSNYLFYNNFKENIGFHKAIKDHEKFLQSKGYINYAKKVGSVTYVSKFIELDPRLSEIHRWWFDYKIKEGKDCEIINTPAIAEKVLKLFIVSNDLLDEYLKTQEEFKFIMEIARLYEIEDEIYQKLSNRIPGLAKKNTITNDPTAMT